MIPFFSGSLSEGLSSGVNTPTSSFPSPDVFHSFTTLTSDAGYPVQMAWSPALNCGVYPGDTNGRDDSQNTATGRFSHSGNAQIHFNQTDQARFAGMPCVKFIKDTEDGVGCNSGEINAQRAELHIDTNQHGTPGDNDFNNNFGAEGNVFYTGRSFMFMAMDFENECTLDQYRGRCGTGSPLLDIVFRPDIEFGPNDNAGIVLVKGTGGTIHKGTPLLGDNYIEILRNENFDSSKLGQWFDIVVGAKMTTQTDGWVKVWIAEATPDQPSPLTYANPLIHVSGIQTAYENCFHRRFGLYGWEADDLTPTQIGSANWLSELYVSSYRTKFAGSPVDPGEQGFLAVIPRAA